jgi:hypothetical protein
MQKISFTFEQSRPGYAHSYVMRDEQGKELGQIWNSENGVGALLAQLEGAYDLATTLRGMFHDLQIFYGKHRDKDNPHFKAIKEALNKSFKYTPGWRDLE